MAAVRTKTFRLDPELVRRMNNALAACAGFPDYLRQDAFVEQWLWKAVKDLERRRNDGNPFPDGPPLRPGRRPS